MELIQSLYVFILNSIFAVTGKIDKRIRTYVICLTVLFFMGLSVYNFVVHPNGPFLPKFERDVIGCLCLAVIALMSIDGKIKKAEWNRQFTFIWYGLAFLVFISAFLHSIEDSYWLWSIAMLIGFPGFYLIWQNREDYDTLYKIVSYAVSIVIFAFFVISLFTASSEQFVYGRYSSIMNNVNHLGKLAVAGVMTSLYLFTVMEHKWIYLLSGGLSLGMALLSVSRTALLIMGVQVIIFIIWEIKTGEGKSKILYALIILYITAIISEKGVIYCIHVHDTGSFKTIETEEGEVEEGTFKPRAAAIGGAVFEIAKAEEPEDEAAALDTLKNRFDTERKDLNQISSGRIDVWKYYISQLNFKGNDWIKHIKSNPINNWAHNDIIEVAFRSGIVAGFFDFLFFLYMGIYVCHSVFSRKVRGKRDLFTVLAIVAYSGNAMLNTILFPFRVHFVFMAYISFIPLFDRRSEIRLKKAKVLKFMDYFGRKKEKNRKF